MANDKGMIWAKVAGGVLVAAAVGFGGFNLATTGCVLGSCSAETDATADVIPVSAGSTEKSDCSGGTCPMTGKPLASGEAALTHVSDEAAGTDCQAKGETTGRPACTCPSTDECARDAQTAAVSTVAHEGKACDADKAGCDAEKKAACAAEKAGCDDADKAACTDNVADGEGAVCPITGKKLTQSDG